jgi:large repetitive protein
MQGQQFFKILNGESAMSNATRKGNKRSKLGLMVLEPRWMFDGAGAATAAHAHPDAAALALIPVVQTPLEVRAVDPALNGGKLEAVFVDTSLPNYQSLEAAVRPGVAIEEIASGQSGLAQMAAWARTHSAYAGVSLISAGAKA